MRTNSVSDNLVWSTIDAPQNVKAFIPSAVAGLGIVIPAGGMVTPLFFFGFLCNFAWTILVTKTNRYDTQKGAHNYAAVDETEMRAFIGLIIGMGIARLPAIQDY